MSESEVSSQVEIGQEKNATQTTSPLTARTAVKTARLTQRRYSRLKRRIRNISENDLPNLSNRLSQIDQLTTQLHSEIDQQLKHHYDDSSLNERVAELELLLEESQRKNRDQENELANEKARADAKELQLEDLKSNDQSNKSFKEQLDAALALQTQLESTNRELLAEIEELNTKTNEFTVDKVTQEVRRENDLLRESAAESEEMIQSLKSRISNLQDSSTAVPDDDSESTTELRNEIDSLEQQVIFLSDELDQKRADTSAQDPETETQLTELRQQLLDARREAVELRMQNTDLADQLAREAVETSNGNANEPISWEERKRRLLEQLEAEENGEATPMNDSERLNIEQVIEQTQCEIDRRDNEITELRRLVEEQSNAHEGVAVGAAAIAQMIDTDSVVSEEREKLTSLQQELEDKLRTAEIELSRERAKLARERLELEENQRRLEEFRHEEELSKSSPNDPQESHETKRGRWLARLGLREE